MRRIRSSRELASLLLVSLCMTAGPLAARAAEDVPFTIKADSIEYDSARSVYVGRGNVRISEGSQTLTADWVMFSSETRQGLASGNVVHRDGPDTLTGDFLQFDIDSLRGFLREGVLTSEESQYHLTAEELRRTGRQTYTFKKTRFTTCDCPDGGRKPWEVAAETAEMEVGGYATARNATFEVFGVPALWVPWAGYPLKKKRTTGFLFPELNTTNRSGFDVGLPFYWAARHDLNVVLTPQYLQKRGVKGKAELDWELAGGSKGDFFFTMLSDGEVDDDDPQEAFDELRWAVDTRQDWRLPFDTRAKLDVTWMRDNQFVRDFRDLRDFIADRFVESEAFANRAFFESGWVQAQAGARWADDFQNPDDLDRDDFLVQRLPEAQLHVLAKPVAEAGPVRLVTAFDADYAYFYSREKASDRLPNLVVGDDLFVDTGIDGVPSSQEQNSAGLVVSPDQHADDFATSRGPEGDGVFQEGELLGDRGHRLWLHPRVSAPVRVLDAVELVPELGYHLTLYDTQGQGFDERGMVTARLDARTRLRREFAPAFSERPVSHVIEPFVSWGLVQDAHQRNNPLFIPETALPQERQRLLDLDNVTGDPADRIERFHGITVGVRNQLMGRAVGSKLDPETGERIYLSDQSRLMADVTLAYDYQIWGNRLGNLVLDGAVWPWSSWTGRFQVNYDTSRNEVDEAFLSFAYWSLEGHNLAVQYRLVENIPLFFEEFRTDRDRLDDFEQGFDRVNQLWASGRWAVTERWALTYDVVYTFEEALFLNNRAGVEYLSGCGCWAVRVVGDFRRQTGFDLGVRFTLVGLGEDRVRPFSGGGGGTRYTR